MTDARVQPGARWSAWALWPTAALSWVALAQVLSFQGLMLWVVGASIVTAGVVLTVARAGRPLLALGLGAVVTVGLAALANAIGGDGAGPIARSCLLACGLIMASALLLTTTQPLLMLAPALAFEAAALGLGGATRAVWMVGAWAVAAVVTAAMLGPYRRADLRGRTRLWPLAGMLLAAGAVAVVAVAVLAPHLEHPWTIRGALTSVENSAPTTTPPPPVVTPQTPPVAQTADTLETIRPWLLMLALALLLVIVLLALWRIVVALQWWRRRRRLHSGSPAQQVIGAWTWVRLARARYDRALPAHASPDVAVTLARATADPSLAAVAESAADVSFRPDARTTDDLAERAWRAARAAGRRPRAPLTQRIRCGYRTPRMAGSALSG